jgi:hypothetical protein
MLVVAVGITLTFTVARLQNCAIYVDLQTQCTNRCSSTFPIYDDMLRKASECEAVSNVVPALGVKLVRQRRAAVASLPAVRSCLTAVPYTFRLEWWLPAAQVRVVERRALCEFGQHVCNIPHEDCCLRFPY